MTAKVRTHFMLPKELLDDFDSLLGEPGKRSETVAKLIEEWVRRERAIDVFTRLAGFVKAEDHPEWQTSEDVAAWVRNLRREYRTPTVLPLAEGEEE